MSDRRIEGLSEGSIPHLLASGGFVSPSESKYPLVGQNDGCYIPLPKVSVNRGGLKYGDLSQLAKAVRTADPAPVGAGAGHWEYALRSEDGEVVSCRSYYDQAAFTSREEALEQLAWFDGVLVRRWVPDPPEWEVA